MTNSGILDQILPHLILLYEYIHSISPFTMKLNTSLLHLVSLKCSMDVQSSDGRSLLLKYVSSYVTKMKDHELLKGLKLSENVKIL